MQFPPVIAVLAFVAFMILLATADDTAPPTPTAPQSEVAK